MYDSNGKKCDTMNHTTKMLLIAGCSAGKPFAPGSLLPICQM
jgi:hypothetical protein